MIRRLVLSALGLLLVTGCGADPQASRPAPTHNATDVMFLQMTLEHHRQAADLLGITAEKARRPEVRALAETMRAQAAEETARMTGWLAAWAESSTPDPDAGAHAGHGDVHSLLPEHVDEVRRAPEAEVEQMALNVLVGHLHNVVAVARLEAGGGADPQAKALAARIAETRETQIQQMLTLLAG